MSAAQRFNILIAHEMFHGLHTNNSCKDKFLAIKTDMSKAYDRVEWSFVKRLLLKMGFSIDWVALMMQYVSSVNYKVLLNGQPKGHIVPERGLRQCDPLSPYLFIICTEALIANIRKEEREKRLTGLKLHEEAHIFLIFYLRMIVYFSVRPLRRNVGLY